MAKYECPCGYVYDPEEGDYEHGIDSGTSFENLPDAWLCHFDKVHLRELISPIVNQQYETMNELFSESLYDYFFSEFINRRNRYETQS